MWLVLRSKHALWLLVAAIVVGIFYIGPQLLIWESLDAQNKTYLSPQLSTASDVTYFYLPRAREVADGHFPPGDLFFEGGGPTLLNPLPPAFAAIFVALLGGDPRLPYLAINFVFAGILFLLFYALGYLVSRRRLYAFFVGFLGILTPIALHLPRAFFSFDNFLNIIVKNFYPLIKTPLAYLFFARIDDPLITLTIYLPAIIFMYAFWQKPGYRSAIGAGIFAGLLFHTYFHYWVYWTVALGLIFIYLLLRRDNKSPHFRGFLVTLAITALLALPYFVNYVLLKNLDSFDDLVLRIGTEVGRGFRISVWPDYFSYALAAILVYLVYFKKLQEKSKAAFFLLLLLAGPIVFNIQLLTGYLPYPGHFRKALSPILFLIFIDLLFNLIRFLEARSIKFRKLLAAALIVMTALLVVKKAVNIGVFVSPREETLAKYVFPREIMDSWRWIQRNLSREPKIISSSFITSIYLSDYTSARPFLPNATLSTAANRAIEDRYLAANKIFGVTKETLEARLRGEPKAECQEFCNNDSYYNLRDDHIYLYHNYFRDRSFDWAFTSSKKSIPEAKIRELIERYSNLAVDWRVLEADYLYYGPWERQFSTVDFKNNSKLELLFHNGAVEIYRILRA